jgi:PAP2 superfamily protein
MKAICALLIVSLPALARADVVHDWNDVALAAVERSSSPPPVAARALAMMHVAIFDAVNSVEPTHQAFRFYVPESTTASREAAATQAAYRVLLQLYPNERARFEDARAQGLAQIAEGAAKSAGIRLGDVVATRVIDWRNSDRSDRSVSYMPGTQPGQWRPTPPEYKPALLPHWGTVAPFGISYASQFRPPFPPELTSAEYTRDFHEVRMLGAANSVVRNEEQTEIAHFWADGPGTVTPPGHWNRIARNVAESRGLSLQENARLFALLNVALADAAIVCWDMKYACNFWRPVTAIHEAENDGNFETIADADWRPLLVTPPFPSCTSGHSSFSGAAAQMLSLFFGTDSVEFTDESVQGRPARTFASFSQAADEAGRSRIYGGIHFEFDNAGGQKSGRALSQYIYDNYMRRGATTPAGGQIAQTVYRPTSADNAGWVSGSDTTVSDASRTNAQVVTECVPVICYYPVTYTYQTVTYTYPPAVAVLQPAVVYVENYGW